MHIFDRARIDRFFEKTAGLTRAELMDGCVYVVAKLMPNDRHGDTHTELMMKLLDLHAMDYISAGRTGNISRRANTHARLKEMDKGGAVKKRSSASYHFKDGLKPRNSAFSRADATAIESRNYREIERHMTANKKVLKTALEVSGAASLQDFVDLIKNHDKHHDMYNKVVAELESKHLSDADYAYGEMGWRRNSDRWYLSPTAIKMLSDFLS